MQTKQAQWAGHIAAWQSGYRSQVDYCQEQGISLSSFRYWRQKLSSARLSVDSSAGLLPIQVSEQARNAGLESLLEVQLPNGILLKLPGSDTGLLNTVLRTLIAC